ncbi:MAG: hypothetical protein H6505_03210 [Calditrichaeota bacterium]|nr:hypothetical protein [Calditrichota bacterium]
MKRCRTLWVLALSLCLAMMAWADENEDARTPGGSLDQGGDVCATALAITSIPFCDTGTTAGYNNDYQTPCQPNAFARDVVYSMTPSATSILTFSLCGSSFNTALHIWRGCPGQGGVLVCCSDDVCGDDACCSGVTVVPGSTYYIVVDGGLGGSNFGDYILNVVTGADNCPSTPCEPTCDYLALDIEPNNACSGSAATFACGDTVCGFAGTNDNDYYNFRIVGPDCREVTIDVFGNDTPGWYPFGLGLNPEVQLINSTCTLSLAYDDNGGFGNDARISGLCLEPGTYKLRVAPRAGSGTSGPYIIATSCITCDCPDTCLFENLDFEPSNNSCATTQANITCLDTLCGEISTQADQDWYRFNFTQYPCADLHIAVYGNDTQFHFPYGQGLNPKVSIWSADCSTMLAQDSDGGIGLDALLDSLCLPAGSYNLLIESEGGIGPYELWVWCTPCECQCPYPSRDFEPNNSCTVDSSGYIACGDTLCGDAEPQGVDYYWFYIPGPECQNITFDIFGNSTPGYYPFAHGLDPAVFIYNFDCSMSLAFDFDSGVGDDARVTACLEPGLYKVLVTSENAAINFGPYIIAMSCEECACPEPCPYPNFDVEPINNQCGTFNHILHCDELVCGEIIGAAAPDQDWYVIQITDGCRQLYIDILGDDTGGYYPFGQGLNTAAELWNAGCDTLLYQDSNSGNGEDARVSTACLEPGIYMLRVYGEQGTQGPYIVAVACEACPCPPPCDVICPEGGLPENEPCPSFNDTTNGGCDSPLRRALPLRCGNDRCGTGFADPGVNYVDSDWYRMLVNDTNQVRLCLESEFDAVLNLWYRGPGVDDCIGLDLVDCITVPACSTLCLSNCLSNGLYYAEVQPTGFMPVPCLPYVLSMDCSPCEPSGCEAPDSVVIAYPDTLDAGDSYADIVLRWPPVPGASEYRIYRSPNNNNPVVVSPANYVATTTDTFFVDTGRIVNNGIYEIFIYEITAYCGYNHPPCDQVPTAREPKSDWPLTPRK